MRHTRSQTKQRRSHHALKGVRLSETEAGVKHPRHKALLDGTPYRGRSVGKGKAAAEAPVKKTKGEVKVDTPPVVDKEVSKEAAASKKPTEKKIKK